MKYLILFVLLCCCGCAGMKVTPTLRSFRDNPKITDMYWGLEVEMPL